MVSARRAMLLSGLVLPGLGQWRMGLRLRGLVFMLGSLLPVPAMFVRIMIMGWRVMAPPAGALIYIPTPDKLAEIHSRAWAENWWLMAIIVAFWLASVADAWREGRKKESGGGEV